MTLDELIKRHHITAAWFWVASISAGSYAENEQFDVVFTRQTDLVVGGGYNERRTFYVQGITTAQGDSRRKHGGKIVRPDLLETLAYVIRDAHEAAQYATWGAWAVDTRDTSRSYKDALADFEDWEVQRERHRQLVAWASDEYDAYVKAAEQYAAGH